MSDVFSDDSEEVAIDIDGDAYVPPDVDSFTVESITGKTMALVWEADESQSDLYQVRFSPLTSGALWSTMTILAEQQGKRLETQTRDGTFAVKAIGFGGVMSAAPVFAVVSGSEVLGINVVQTITEAGAWTGTKLRTVVVDGELRLSDGSNIFAAADAFALADVFSPGGQMAYATMGTYDLPTVFDLGAVYTSRVTPSVLARGFTKTVNLFAIDDVFSMVDVFGFDASDFDVQILVSKTQSDPALGIWSNYEICKPGDITARALRFRLALYSNDPGVTPSVSAASVTIDMPDREIRGTDIVSNVAGTAIVFSPGFRASPALQITAQNLAQGDYWQITGKSEAGFSIRFFLSGGAGVSRTFDYIAKSYGVKR